MDTIPIRYFGGKPIFRDHLYGTDLEWAFGDEQQVPAAAAVKLLQHPEFADAREEKTPITVEPEARREPEIEENEAPLVNLETMTKAQLLTYAQRNFGVELDGSAKKADLIDTVRRQMGKRVI